MRTILTIVLITMLSACAPEPAGVVISKEEQLKLDEQLFKTCMELAAGLPAHANDANHNIVDDCDSRAYWRSRR